MHRGVLVVIDLPGEPANDAGTYMFQRALPNGTYEFTTLPAPYDVRVVRRLRLQGWYPLVGENGDETRPAILDAWDPRDPHATLRDCLRKSDWTAGEISCHVGRSRYVAV